MTVSPWWLQLVCKGLSAEKGGSLLQFLSIFQTKCAKIEEFGKIFGLIPSFFNCKGSFVRRARKFHCNFSDIFSTLLMSANFCH